MWAAHTEGRLSGPCGRRSLDCDRSLSWKMEGHRPVGRLGSRPW